MALNCGDHQSSIPAFSSSAFFLSIQVLRDNVLFHQSRFSLAVIYFINPASAQPWHDHRIISSIQILLYNELFHLSSFQFSSIVFIYPASTQARILSSCNHLIPTQLCERTQKYFSTSKNKEFILFKYKSNKQPHTLTI